MFIAPAAACNPAPCRPLRPGPAWHYFEVTAPRDDAPTPLPPVREQWRRLSSYAKLAAVAVPLAVVGVVMAIDLRAGVTVAVLFAGMGAASVVYVKNRTDRVNAAMAEEQRERSLGRGLHPGDGGTSGG